MRLRIEADSMTTAEIRSLMAALVKVAGLKATEVHLNGPDHWALRTEFVHSFPELAEVVTTADLHMTERYGSPS